MKKVFLIVLLLCSISSCINEEELRKDKPFESGNVFSYTKYADEMIIENYMREDSL